jgi:hypothetical protein
MFSGKIRVGDARRRMRTYVAKPLAALACVAQVAACASSPDSVSARYVSPNMYQNWSCEQLWDERMRLTKEVDRVSGLQRENAGADAALMTVGLIVFWPALIGLAATKDRKDELGRLKGEYEAVDLSMRSKQCTAPVPGGQSVPATPTPQTDIALAQAEGTYKGTGKTDAWCQTPTLTLTIKGTTVEGSLSEADGGRETSSVKGTMDYAGVMTLDFKGSRDTYFTGRSEAAVRNGILSVGIRTKTSTACTYNFELKKS